MARKLSLEDVTDILDRFIKRLDDDKRFAEGCIGDTIWNDALSAILQPLFGAEKVTYKDALIKRLLLCLEKIQEKSIIVPEKIYAQVLFAARCYPEAIAYWDKSGETKSVEYYQAKAATESYPDRIIWLSKLGHADEILQDYSATPEIALTPEQAAVVANTLRTFNRLGDAVSLSWEAGIANSMLDLAKYAFQKGNRAAATTALHAGIRLLIKQGRWEPLITFMSSQEFTPEKDWKEKVIRQWVKSQTDAIRITIIKSLARSDELTNASPHHQRGVSDFLRNFLRVKDGKWKDNISVAEAGASLERAGRFTDTIAFYEAVLREKPSKEVKRLVQQRWIVNKKRQLDHERIMGSPDKVDDIERELKLAQTNWRINLKDDADRYPLVTPLERPYVADTQATPVAREEVYSPQDQPLQAEIVRFLDEFELTAGPFRFEVSRKNKRCNVTHTDTKETAYIKIGEKKCGGEVDFNKVDEKRWICEPWKLTVEFPTIQGDILTIIFDEIGVRLAVC